ARSGDVCITKGRVPNIRELPRGSMSPRGSYHEGVTRGSHQRLHRRSRQEWSLLHHPVPLPPPPPTKKKKEKKRKEEN
ncbi:hypothetical protein IscW_ISCW010332, partial [Ixodes scapularis]